MNNYLSILLILFIFSCKSPIDSTNSLFQYIAGIDIREDIEGRKLYFGTGSGIRYFNFNDTTLSIHTITNKNLPEGGTPATILFDNSIAVSGVIGEDEILGTGISYANTDDEIWTYLPQPIDLDVSSDYKTISWGNQYVQSYICTTEINNVTYDLSIAGDYIYSAGWASGIRRYNYITNTNWEIIPLPMDLDTHLVCGDIDISTYQLNPLDPVNGGSHNHKGFSVYYDSEYIWVGTANGINRGTMRSECIDWVHYTSAWDNISGNWVIGFMHQEYNTHTRLWAITWSTSGQGEFSALSYTDNSGETWETVMPAGIPEKVYNLYSDSSSVWASTESGLYYTYDQLTWDKIESPYGENQPIYTSIIAKNDFNAIWIGTEYGFARTYNLGNSWEIFSIVGDVNYSGLLN